MKKALSLLLISVVAAACATAQSVGSDSEGWEGVRQGDQPNILVIGEDADKDTVPRSSRVFRRVLDALSNEMSDEGFNVYDETAVSLSDFAQGRVRRTDVELIDVARSIKRPPIDVAVIYSIFTAKREHGYTNKLQVRISGRLLNVRNGRRLGNFEVGLPRPDNVSPRCDRDCELEAVGRNARILARDLGAVLARKLDWLSPPRADRGTRSAPERSGLATAYSLVFFGFSPREIREIEDGIVALPGYEHHRLVKNALQSAEYCYETGAASVRVNRSLRLLLSDMGVEARVSYAGSRLSVEKISLRRSRS